MNDLKTEVLPGGIRVASGGTRTDVRLERPWQTEIKVEPATCPFETKEQEQEANFEREGGWRVLPNRYTPFPWHKLIIPARCWPPDELRLLGGTGRIAAALAIAESIISKTCEDAWLGVHIGPGAGQNIGHLHYHLVRPMERTRQSSLDADLLAYCRSLSRLVFQDDCCTITAGGCRAGQCFIVPTGPASPSADSLAVTLTRIISLYSRRFESKQGMAPDYMLGLTFSGGRFAYGVYVPVLNNWGFTEYLGLIETTPLILPWSHEATARHLRGE